MSSSDRLHSLRVLAHPLRLRALSLLTGSAMSAAEVARQLGESQANVSYHLRRLHEAGLLEITEEIKVRGGRAKRYRHDAASGERLSAGDREDHIVVAEALAEELRRRSEQRLPGGPGAMTDAELWVRPEEWRELIRLGRELGEQLHAMARPPHSTGAIRVSATLLLFEMTKEQAP
jgi:DNA-binding transcriptional ArsR family regulator